MHRRLCLECFEAVTDYLDEPLCPACALEHEFRGIPIAGPQRYPKPGSWGYEGPTADDVDIAGGDLDDGFFIATLSERGDYAWEGSAIGI